MTDTTTMDRTESTAYACTGCGASGCKLWRLYQSTDPRLLCAPCAAADQNKDISDLDDNGTRTGQYGRRTDQIGWYVPAAPAPNGGMWGYSSVPDEDVERWRKLPSLPPTAG